jgi:ribosomal protein S2
MKVNFQSNIIIFNIIYFIYRLGSSVINIRKFWEKLLLAARAIVAVENPADVCAISCQPQGKKKR